MKKPELHLSREQVRLMNKSLSRELAELTNTIIEWKNTETHFGTITVLKEIVETHKEAIRLTDKLLSLSPREAYIIHFNGGAKK